MCVMRQQTNQIFTVRESHLPKEVGTPTVPFTPLPQHTGPKCLHRTVASAPIC